MHTMCTYSPISPLRTPDVKNLRQAIRPRSPKKPTSHLDPSSTSHREIMRPEYSMREAATPHLGCVVPVVPRIGCVFRGDCMNYFGRLQVLFGSRTCQNQNAKAAFWMVQSGQSVKKNPMCFEDSHSFFGFPAALRIY